MELDPPWGHSAGSVLFKTILILLKANQPPYYHAVMESDPRTWPGLRRPVILFVCPSSEPPSLAWWKTEPSSQHRSWRTSATHFPGLPTARTDTHNPGSSNQRDMSPALSQAPVGRCGRADPEVSIWRLFPVSPRPFLPLESQRPFLNEGRRCSEACNHFLVSHSLDKT